MSNRYIPVTPEEAEEEKKGGNIGLPFGLCEKYGIQLPPNARPRDAWAALKKKTGLTPEDFYKDLRQEVGSEREKIQVESTGTEKELGIEKEKFSTTDNVTFYSKMEKARESLSEENRWRVDIHDIEDYKNDKLFVSKGGSCVAIEPNGNIISVCKKNGDETVRGKDLIKYAVGNGGDRLDAFGKGLYSFYTKQGFEPVSWTLFNEKYAPEGWDKKRDEPEPVIFYKYTGKVTNETFEEFKNRVKPSVNYDMAMEIRDKEI